MYRAIINTILITLMTMRLWGQEEKKEEEESMKGSHRLATGLGHTHLAKGKDADGKSTWLPLASWSLNYDYWIGDRWAIGLQTDLVLEKFVVEESDGQELEREKPLALVPVGIFKPWRHFSFIAGTGVEFEKSENLWLTRLGVEFGAALPKNWEAGIALIWDAKWDHYDSWVLEFSFSKIFRKRR